MTTSIGERIKELRKSENLNQQEFAEKVGVTQAAISYIEKNEEGKGISIDLVNKISSAYNVSLDYLVKGVGPGITKTKFIEERVEDIEDILYQIMNVVSINTNKMNKKFNINNEKDEAYLIIEQAKSKRPDLLVFKRAVDFTNMSNSNQSKKEDKK